MITLSKKEIDNEKIQTIQKSISKPKQKNQYTISQKFSEKFIKKGNKETCKVIDFLELSIPKQITNNLTIRLKSNIQFPRNADCIYQLGKLNVDYYSYNYKINRIDRKGNFTTVTFDLIDNGYTPIESLYKIFEEANQNLLESFELLHKMKLEKKCFTILKENELFDFENSINKPCTGYISKFDGDSFITQQRFMNDEYLNYIGINAEMLIHYSLETGFLPIPLFFSEKEYSSQHLSQFFKLNTFNQNVNDILMTNYRGEKFPVKVTFHRYFYFNQNDQCYYEYLFFIWDVDRRYLSKIKIYENYIDYFNLNQQQLNTPQIFGSDKRCGFKEI